ncbi:hypothetical protein H7X69_00425 [Candidatus Saccharibacteria bacterium]|nr:hypothetical protein [Candidatus Saccharibacteria bacterium]
MKNPKMTASKLRAILSATVIVLLVLSAVGFYFGQNWLRTMATSVSQTVADSKASGGDVTSLKKIQADLLARQGIVDKAGSIMSSSQNYQTKVIEDLAKYAAEANIIISNYSFAAPTAAAPTTGAAAAPATGATSVTVTLTSPITYTKLLKFMSAIESNLPKMQVSSINLGRVAAGASDSVKTEQLTVEVYTQ